MKRTNTTLKGWTPANKDVLYNKDITRVKDAVNLGSFADNNQKIYCSCPITILPQRSIDVRHSA